MDIEERLKLIRQVGEEIVTEDELRQLLEAKDRPVAYDGFEPTSRMHIAHGILRAINVNKMTKAGCRFKIWIADWFAQINNKMGGDLSRIGVCGEYMMEVWKACGMETDNIEFLWSGYVMGDDSYWQKVIQIAKSSTALRIMRCSQIMGRSEHEQLSAAQILYPCMQAADIFHLKADICQLGMDQRKVNILAREIGPKIGFWKPVVVSHHMLMGLNKPSVSTTDKLERSITMKMSRSNPDNAVFMTDTEEDVARKIENAYCPARVAEDNPVMEFARYLVFEKFPAIEVRKAGSNDSVSCETYGDLERRYVKGEIHPKDLKAEVAKKLNELLRPVRERFETSSRAGELLAQVEKFDAGNGMETKTFK